MATNKYVVKRGDTWETIAKRLGISPTNLAKRNSKIAKLTAGLSLAVPQSAGSSNPPLPTGAPTGGVPTSSTTTSGGGGTPVGGSGKYKKTEKGYQYKYNAKTGRDHEGGAWLPTVAYNAWQQEPDSHFVYNPKNGRWEARKGKPITPGWTEKQAKMPYGGKPPANWAHNYKYYVNAEKNQYWYWDEYDWMWKLNKKSNRGGGGGGGGNSGPTPPTRTEQQYEDRSTPPTRASGGGSITYPEGFPSPAMGFSGPMQTNMASIAPIKSYVNPQYIGLVNWRF
jgi:hypothetical protein